MRRLTRGSTPLYQVMKRDMMMRTPVRSGNPRVDSSTMLPMVACHTYVTAVCLLKLSPNCLQHTWMFDYEHERKLRPV